MQLRQALDLVEALTTIPLGPLGLSPPKDCHSLSALSVSVTFFLGI